jgi:hypothetical protein
MRRADRGRAHEHGGEPSIGLVTPLRACGPADGSVARGMKKISYRGYRFPPEIIQQAIWLYLRFTLSLRDVEDCWQNEASWSLTKPFAAG